MARARIPVVIIGSDGTPAADVDFTIINRADNAEATIYAGEIGGTVLSVGTVTSDEFGQPPGWLETGEYAGTAIGAAGVNPSPIPFEIIPAEDLLALSLLIPPVGVLMPFEGDPGDVAAPYFFCDGSEIDAAPYPKLAAHWGTGGASRHGAAAVGKIRLPDTKGRSLFGKDSGAGRNANTPDPGQAGGSETVTLTNGQIPAHTHPDDIAYAAGGTHDHGGVTGGMTANADHDHAINNQGTGTYSTGSTGFVDSVGGGATYGPFQRTNLTSASRNLEHGHGIPNQANHSHTKSGGVQANTGGGGAHSNMPPHLTIEGFIVRAG